MTDVTNDTETHLPPHDLRGGTDADSVLANWQAQSAPLTNYAAEAQTMLDETQRALGALWEKAELEGDEASKQMISDSWQRAQALHDQVVHMDAGLAGAGATIQTLDDQRQAALDELKSITEALDSYDTSHPALESYAEEISSMAEEYVYKQAEMYMDDSVRENFYDEIDQRMQEVFGEVDDQTSLLMDFIYGEISLNSVQAGLFTQFIDSLRDNEEDES